MVYFMYSFGQNQYSILFYIQVIFTILDEMINHRYGIADVFEKFTIQYLLVGVGTWVYLYFVYAFGYLVNTFTF